MATYNQVSYGSQDKETNKQLQKMLNNAGNYGLEEDGIFGQKTLDAVKDYQQKNSLTVDGIVGKDTWGALTGTQTGGTGAATASTSSNPGFQYSGYEKSDVVKQAEDMIQQHLSGKPGQFQYAGQAGLDEVISQILNRDKFSYDLNGDALYQQYKDQYTTQGKLAMMDTMGQAQAMTGGYGNSYAQSAGQQAYQGYLQQLNDRVPELYQLAYDKYNQEGQDLLNRYSLLSDQKAQEYEMHRDNVSDYYTELDRLTEDARYKAEDEYGKWMDKTNLDYSIARDQVADEKWQKEFDQTQDAINYDRKQDDWDKELAGAQALAATGDYSQLGKLYGWTDTQIKQADFTYAAEELGLTEQDVSDMQAWYGNGTDLPGNVADAWELYDKYHDDLSYEEAEMVSRGDRQEILKYFANEFHDLEKRGAPSEELNAYLDNLEELGILQGYDAYDIRTDRNLR